MRTAQPKNDDLDGARDDPDAARWVLFWMALGLGLWAVLALAAWAIGREWLATALLVLGVSGGVTAVGALLADRRL